jgi:hypothetical protein
LKAEESSWTDVSISERIIDVDGKLLTIQCYSQNISELIKERERFSQVYNSMGSKNAFATFYLNLTQNTCTCISKGLALFTSCYCLARRKNCRRMD